MFIIGFASRDEVPDHSEYPDWVIDMAEEAYELEIEMSEDCTAEEAREEAEFAYRLVLADYDEGTSRY